MEKLYYCSEENIGPKPIEWWENYYNENISKAPEDCGWATFEDWWEDMRYNSCLIKAKDNKGIKDMKKFEVKTKNKTYTVMAKDKASAVRLVKMKIRHNVKDSLSENKFITSILRDIKADADNLANNLVNSAYRNVETGDAQALKNMVESIQVACENISNYCDDLSQYI